MGWLRVVGVVAPRWVRISEAALDWMSFSVEYPPKNAQAYTWERLAVILSGLPWLPFEGFAADTSGLLQELSSLDSVTV